jgi:hypothetical protein
MRLVIGIAQSTNVGELTKAEEFEFRNLHVKLHQIMERFCPSICRTLCLAGAMHPMATLKSNSISVA